jgi:C4-dicarboxylate-specific signal transduction histidine kinase
VKITYRLEGDEAMVVVTDTGSGIPEELLPRLCNEPIKKSKGTRGLGMGLLKAQTIAETYGGEIRIEATGPIGTSIVVLLPIETQGR